MHWENFADIAGRMGSALYEKLARGVAGDEEMQALAAQARPGQPKPNTLFGAVHFLLLRGAEHPLRDFYPTLGGTRDNSDAKLYSLFQDFVARHRDDISALVSTRVTNTNEVGRCAFLHAGFRVLARHVDAPVHFIEIGPSAGLNLIWDKYGVRYNRDGRTIGAISPTSPLVLDCELRGEGTPPLGPAPVIASRVGLELNPVNLADPNDRDWLRALVWPDQAARLARLDSAIALFSSDPPTIRAGDALALLPEVLAATQPGPVCVYHTWVTYQFSTAMKEALERVLEGAGRPLFRLSHEGDGTRDSLLLSRYGQGPRTDRHLAWAHPHGTWLEWQAVG
jgi:hypothetical protein